MGVNMSGINNPTVYNKRTRGNLQQKIIIVQAKIIVQRDFYKDKEYSKYF